MSTVTTKGQVTIPTNIRKLLGISSGDKIYFETDSTIPSIKIRKISSSITEELAGSLSSPVGYIDLDTVRKKVGSELGKRYK